MALDPTIIELMHHLTWRPPAIVQEIGDVRVKTELFRENTLKKIEAAEKKLDAWVEDGVRLREQIWSFVETENPDLQKANDFEEVIKSIDTRNEEMALTVERAEKQFRRQVKQAARISKKVFEVVDEIDKRLARLMRRELEARIEFALFLRAVKSEYDPEARGGVTFEDPQDLERYLGAILHS